jgi:hypothetical protein
VIIVDLVKGVGGGIFYLLDFILMLDVNDGDLVVFCIDRDGFKVILVVRMKVVGECLKSGVNRAQFLAHSVGSLPRLTQSV